VEGYDELLRGRSWLRRTQGEKSAELIEPALYQLATNLGDRYDDVRARWKRQYGGRAAPS